ncbi:MULTISPECIES: hypothetical protein [Enterobacteriaceae]|uniref:hypothetical protein n=1 Tax=Enterobacteriaceae TaxID=543 RepID=UPI000272B2D5|nr:hypothetical protein [Enterobacter sp. Ag1]EJF31726.1 hypothetical protein A936_09038 [Enterobacter sp. Ag1]
MPKRRNYQEKEERRPPDSPDGLVVAAANNKPFAERFIGVFRLAKAGVKKDGRR